MRFRLHLEASDKNLERHGPEVFTAARTHGHCPSLLFFVSHYHLVRELLQAMFAYFIGNFFVSQIHHGTPPGDPQGRRNLPGVVGLVLGDVLHHHLLRRQPHREGSGKVLDEYPEKPLHRPDDGTVEHDRDVPGVVLPHILGP